MKVIIIGGGWAGCTIQLKNYNFDVKIKINLSAKYRQNDFK